MIAYIVTSGVYSDYGIHAVFSTEDLAKRYLYAQGEWMDDARIEEWEMDCDEEALRNGYTTFFVRISPNGDVLESHSPAPLYFTRDALSGPTKDVHGNFMVYTFAKDAQHAIKIANEQRARAVAMGR